MTLVMMSCCSNCFRTHRLLGRVEAVFTPESEITSNAEKYSDYTFACIMSVNDMHYAAAQVRGEIDSFILSEIDHSVVYDGKVIFAGMV